ncbi:proton-conducting transporter transmembrane domain-containing protein [Pseudoroseomonas sp. WGS1072]|uniref:proton-conducting transporter transmembrane domain-containing protein n=1 Tax=Roseomonas sp. WGS1072 TaxID=3366816 RepID=UPI003BEFD1C5
MRDAALTLAPVALPLGGAALAALLGARPAAQRGVTAVALLALLLGAAALLARVLSAGPIVTAFGGWPAPFGVVFSADPLGAALVLVSAFVACAALLFGRAALRRSQEKAGFHPLFLGMMAGVNGAFLTGDIFNLYVWFEVMLVTAMGLLLLDRSRAQLDGTLRYAAMNILGTILFLTAVALLYGLTGTLNLAELAVLLPQMPPSAGLTVAAFLLLAGFGIKAGFFPLFFWLPASYHTAPIVVAAAFAGLLTKVGVYACLRILPMVLPAVPGLREVMLGMAAATMLAGVLCAFAQWDIRRLLGFSIVSGVGQMLMGLALATPKGLTGAVFYMLHHIVVMAALFLLAGAIRRACGSYDLRRCGGLMRRRPALAALFAVAALSLAGMPPFSGFWAKLLVIDASLRAGHLWLAGMALLVGLLTLYCMATVWIEAFWKDAPPRRPEGPPARPRAVPAPMLWSIGLLAALTLAMGLLVEPVSRFSALAAAPLLPAAGGAP